MISHERSVGDLSASAPQVPRAIAAIATNARTMRAIAATYSRDAGSEKRDAGALTKRMVALTIASVTAMLIQIFRSVVLVDNQERCSDFIWTIYREIDNYGSVS